MQTWRKNVIVLTLRAAKVKANSNIEKLLK